MSDCYEFGFASQDGCTSTAYKFPGSFVRCLRDGVVADLPVAEIVAGDSIEIVRGHPFVEVALVTEPTE